MARTRPSSSTPRRAGPIGSPSHRSLGVSPAEAGQVFGLTRREVLEALRDSNRLADKQGVTTLKATPTRRFESLTAHVDRDLAAEVRRLAEAGNRSVSREVSSAL